MTQNFEASRITTRLDLLDQINHGQSFKYLYFWGHQPQRDGSIGKSCFSQWFDAAFELEGVSYATAEHYMMAEKARLFDVEATAGILAAAHPGEAKQLGREIRNFDPVVWEAKRFEIVVRGNAAKFSQHGPLQQFLLGTGDRVLVEASPQDKVWGIGLVENDPAAQNPDQWKGLNLLGFALMAVREQLRENC
jgi:ribA/ribD-fused uncharacterized protein